MDEMRFAERVRDRRRRDGFRGFALDGPVLGRLLEGARRRRRRQGPNVSLEIAEQKVGALRAQLRRG